MRGSLATLLALAWLLGVGPLQGVYSQEYAPPTESECRPYIEKALKEHAPPDTPPASIDDTGSSEESAGPEVPLNEQTDPEATIAETAPESVELNSAENVGEVTSGEGSQDQGSIEITEGSDGVKSTEQETSATEEGGNESVESLEQGEASASSDTAGESTEQDAASAAEDAPLEQAGESVEQIGDNVEQTGDSVEQTGDSVEQTGDSVEQTGDSVEQGESTESLEQGEPAAEDVGAESAESIEQEATLAESAESATEQASMESTEEMPTTEGESMESVENAAMEMVGDQSVESSEGTATATDESTESAENVELPASASEEGQEAPTESTEADAASAESTEQDTASATSSENSEEAIPAESAESLEATPDETQASSESLEETVGSESAQTESVESLEQAGEEAVSTESAENAESLEVDATSAEAEPQEDASAASTEATDQEAASSEAATEEAASGEATTEEAVSAEAGTEEAASGEAATEEAASGEAASGEATTEEAVSGEASTEEAVSGEAATEGAASGEAATEEAASGEAATEEAASGEAATEEAVSGEAVIGEAASGESMSEEAAISEEPVGDSSQEPSIESMEEVEETVLSRERRSMDEEVPASVEDTGAGSAEEGSVEELATGDSQEPTPEVTSTEEPAEQVTDESVEQPSAETEATTTAVDEEQAEFDQLSKGTPSSGEPIPETMDEEAQEMVTPEEELSFGVEIPDNLRPRDHIAQILKLDETSVGDEMVLQKVEEGTLKDLKRFYDNAIKPLEMLYKYRDLSNRHFGDPEIFSKPLILFMGPWSGGKSSIINYLLDNEYKRTSLRTGAEPSPAYFNIVMWGEREEVLDGTQLAADWTFSGLQKFGQGLLDRLRGLKLKNRLLEKVNIVEIPGILEIRKQVERLFPFNDACQWFIDRADIIFLVYDPSKLDVGPETEAILDQLKGREYQTRIILNKADQVRPEELMRVQGTLIWNISPLMSSSQPPVMYSTSLWSMPYEIGAPLRLLRAQEGAFLRDMREAIEKRVENKIASARRFAVRVRNHAKMVDCYLTTYYNHKTFFGNRKKISDDIIERPQDYHIYEGLSTLTNISRYDLPDPETYRDFFKLNPLYDFQQLAATCTYFRGCPINRLDVAIAYDLPELVGKYKEAAQSALEKRDPTKS